MSHLPTLITDLAIILVSASIMSLLFKRLKQPVVLGYIVAGILAGPYTTFLPTVMDTANIHTWADIGVIFLLFALGLEFSFKKLVNVGMTAIIATTTIVASMMVLGFLTGLCFGWSHMNSIFLGGMLCMSSTMIIIKVFDDMGLRNQRFSSIVLGILIVEDLFAVLLMVLLSTMAISKHFEGTEMLVSIFKLLTFLLFWFVTGIFLIPTLLKKCKKYLNSESLLVVSLGLCLGMVILATQAGFSSALGAFVMGSILAETMDAERIEHLVQPVKNLFGAIFFVSVGMMINIPILGEYIVPIAILSLVVIFGQVFFASTGVLMAGQPLKVAMQAGFSLAQIGEFSFIIAGLGLSLGVLDNYVYPIIVAVSTITIFTTPYLIKLSEPAYRFADKKFPASWHKYFDGKNASGAHPVNDENTWKVLLIEMGKVVAVYMILCLMIIILALQYLAPIAQELIPGNWGNILLAVAIILLLSPFMRAIMVKKNHSVEFEKLWGESINNRGILIFTIIFRVLLCIGMIAFVLERLFHPALSIAVVVALGISTIFIFSKKLKKRSILIERRFKKNLNARQNYQELHAPIKKGFTNHLLDRDLHLSDFEVKQNYSIVGKTLKELNFRQRCGVNIVTIVRGDKRINIPGGDVLLLPLDHIIVLGTDRQMLIFQRYIDEKRSKYAQKDTEEKPPAPQVSIEQVLIESSSSLVGKTIKTSNIRNTGDCLVVGIEREETSVMNPDIDTEFLEGDVIWVVGEHDKIKQLKDL